MIVPVYVLNWFESKSWHMHEHQYFLFDAFSKNQSSLLVAPTGGGKTLAGFLPSLVDIHDLKYCGLHTLYISPLKALTQNVLLNLTKPIEEMNLKVTIGIRTGDTSSYHKRQQLKTPPNILLTTPESLMLLLSYNNAAEYFKSLKMVIIDELHSFAFTKRGDLSTLALAQLSMYAPTMCRVGLSATVAQPDFLAKWLVSVNDKANVYVTKSKIRPVVHMLKPKNVPYSGYMAFHSIDSIYQVLAQHKMTLIFVNTRSQAEFIFRQLWLINEKNISIAIYHASLSTEQRQKTESLAVNGLINAVVSTSALELGIDWANVDAVIQVGAPHGISRLIQRIGRANHQFDKASLAYIAPVNCFDALEAQAAIYAIDKQKLDFDDMHWGALDVVIQFIINCACSQPIKKQQLLHIIRTSFSYSHIKRDLFYKLFQFAVDGGYTLQHYPEYHRLFSNTSNQYYPASAKVIRRHRQNIGTIIDSPLLKVKVLNKRKDKFLGEIDERFIQGLKAGDSFVFAGEILEYIRVHDLQVETRKTKAKYPKIPSYGGGIMSLTTSLADYVLSLINHPQQWIELPDKVRKWLRMQQRVSYLPGYNSILIEQFYYKKNNYQIIYSFEGRKANHTLGMLLTRRMESLGLKPLHFTVTDYALLICTLCPVEQRLFPELLQANLLINEVDAWLSETTLLKRTFRQIAVISGLTERQIGGNRKSMKQVTFSTDLIFDVLCKYEPNHVLLSITYDEVRKVLLDLDRLRTMLTKFERRTRTIQLAQPSPFSIPILTNFLTEKIMGEAQDEVLKSIENEAFANELMNVLEHANGC